MFIKRQTIRLLPILILIVMFSAFSINTFCQEQFDENDEEILEIDDVIEDIGLASYFEFTLNPSFTISNFGEKVNTDLFGFSGALFKQRNDKRLDFFGIQFSYAHVGAIDEVYPEFEQRTGTNFMNIQFMYRYFPNFYFWRIEPFFEAGIGPQWIYTLTTTTFFEDGASDFNFEDTDWGLSYGVGIGFTLHIADSILFLSKLSMQSGTSVTYEVPGEFNGGLPIDNFNPETSSVDYIHTQLGISYIF